MMHVKITELAGARKNVLGVTLVEMMIAAALFTLAFGAIYMVARATYVNAAFQDAEVAAQIVLYQQICKLGGEVVTQPGACANPRNDSLQYLGIHRREGLRRVVHVSVARTHGASQAMRDGDCGIVNPVGPNPGGSSQRMSG